MLAVTAAAFLLVLWFAMKALFAFLKPLCSRCKTEFEATVIHLR